MDDAGPEDDIRLDVIANWKQFPTQPNARRSPGGTGWLINYRQPVGIMSNVAAFTFPTGWYIKDLPRGAEAYRGVALRLYQLANDHLEQLQGGPSEPIRHSSFSYEDLSSNMIAWYRGALGYTRARVNDICQTISKEQSVELATAIGIDNILDKNREWGKTLLFSDKCEECTAPRFDRKRNGRHARGVWCRDTGKRHIQTGLWRCLAPRVRSLSPFSSLRQVPPPVVG